MNYSSDMGAATAPEPSPFSEWSEEGGVTAFIENAHGVTNSFRRISAGVGGVVFLKSGEVGVTCILVVAPSSTVPEGRCQQFASGNLSSSSMGEFGAAEDLYAKVLSLFTTARAVDFEDGVHSEFSRELVRLIEVLGNSAVEVIASIIIGGKANPAVSAEALKWISHVDQPGSYAFRLWLLEKSLESPFVNIRDAALLGIASVDDQHSISAINHAISRETCPELREDLIQVLKQLDPQCPLY
jgi:hypothetical protein